MLLFGLLYNKNCQIFMKRRLNQTSQIYEISFQLNIISAHISVRFPCKFFIALRNNRNKLIAKTSKDNISAKDGKAEFNENLAFKTYVIYDTEDKKFLNKQTTLGVYLISQRKPDQEKLVGRVTIDLGEVSNNNIFEQSNTYNLDFSSIKDANISFSLKILSKEVTPLTMNQLDMDSFSHLDGSIPDISHENEAYPNKPNKSQNEQRREHIQNGDGKQYENLRDQKIKLQNQNKRLLQLVQKNNKNLLNFQQKQNEQVYEQINYLKDKIQSVQAQKNDIIQELLAQIQQETKSKIELQNKLSDIGNSQSQELEEIKFLREKLERLQMDYEESQRKQLDMEAQNLQIKYQLSEIKDLNQQYLLAIQQKQKLIKQLIHKNQGIIPQQSSQGQTDSLFLRNQIETLHLQIDQLTQQLQSAEAGNSRLDQVSQAYANLLGQYDTLSQKFKEILIQKQRLEEEKRELEQRILKPGQSQLQQDFQRKILGIQSQVQRLKEQLIAHQQRRQHQQQNRKYIEQQLSFLTSQVNTHREKNSQLEDQINILRNSKQNLQKQGGLTQQKHHEERQNFKRMNSQLQEQIRNLEKFVNERESEIMEQREQKQIGNKELRLANDTIKHLEHEIRVMQGQMKQNHRIKQDGLQIINDLKSQVTELNKLRTEYINKEMKLNNQMNNQKTKLEKLQKDLKSKQTTVMQKNMIIDHLNRQIQEEIKKSQELEERISKFAEKESQMRENIFVLEEESKKIYDIVVEQENVLESQDSELNEKDDEIGVLKMQNNQLMDKMMKIDEQNQIIKKQMYELRKNYIEQRQTTPQQITLQQKTQSLLETQQARIQQLQKSLLSKTQDLTQHINQFNRNIQLLEQQRQNLQQKIIQLNKEKGQTKKQKDELNEKIRKCEFNIEELNMKLQVQSQEMSKGRGLQSRELEMKREEFGFLESKNQMMERDIRGLEEEIIEKNRKIQEYFEKIQGLEMKRIQQQNSNPINTTNEKNQIQQNQSLKQTLKTLQQTNSNLHSQISTLQKQLQHQKPSPIKQIKSTISDTSLNSTISSTTKQLQTLLKQRSSKTRAEQAIQILVNNNKMLEDGMSKIIEERGMIQENARKLSLEFQKIKANLLKSKANMQDKRELLNNLKPCQGKVKELIGLAENLSEYVGGLNQEPIDQ